MKPSMDPKPTIIISGTKIKKIATVSEVPVIPRYTLRTLMDGYLLVYVSLAGDRLLSDLMQDSHTNRCEG